MKQLIIIIIAVILFIITSVYANYYLVSSAQDISNHINNIESYSKRQDWISISNELKASQEKWNKTKGIWSILIEHEEIDKIEMSIARLDKYIETRDTRELLAESSNLRLLIQHIPETYFLNYKNVL